MQLILDEFARESLSTDVDHGIPCPRKPLPVLPSGGSGDPSPNNQLSHIRCILAELISKIRRRLTESILERSGNLPSFGGIN